MSAKLTLIKNPLVPEKNRIRCDFPFNTIGEARAWLDGTEVNITVEDWAVGDDYRPKDGELVVIKPIIGGGNTGKVLGLVAIVALTVLTGNMASGAFFKGLAGGVIKATAWTYAAAAATMFIGATLVKRMMMNSASIDYGDYETSTTYSWSEPQTMEGQNNPIAITYGKVQSSGQTLGKFVSYNENGDEVLNWLIGCGEGELAISNIKLNDASINTYTDVTAEIRTGTNDQSVISNFNDTITPHLVGVLMEGTTPTTRTDITGNTTQGLIFKIACEAGLFHTNDDGSLGKAWVKVKLEYKLHSASTWTEWQTVEIRATQSSALRKEYRLDNLPSGQYDVRVTVVERSHSETSSRACVRTTWSYIDTIVYDDFTYPGIALIGLKGVATNQLNGSPTIKFLKERQYVYVWNPDISTYEQKAANNPAWACYDMLTQIQRLLNINTQQYEYLTRGVDKSHIIYEHFAEWADWCDTENIHVNLEVVETGEMLDTINNNIACIGHGLVIRFGTRYGCKWSHIQTPVQMFGMGNIIKDSFSEQFLSLEDRANAVEVTFTDAERDYERRTITIFGDTYNTDATEKSAQITYNGITSYQQAYEEGKYQLACNKYLLRTVAFDADVDSIACTVGDVIVVAHDIIRAAYSGRISKVNGTSVTLPTVDTVDITLNYKLMFRSSEYDTLEDVTCTLAYVNGELVATMTQTPTHAPAVHDIYDLALVSTGRRMYTVQSITRASDFRRHIEALEYNAGIYADPGTAPVIEYTTVVDNPTNVTGLSAKQTAYVDRDGQRKSMLYVSWTPATSGGKYTVLISSNSGQDWKVIRSGISNVNINEVVEPWTTYYVKVITTIGARQSTGTITNNPVLPGTDELPPNVTELNAEKAGDGTRRYYWKFTPPDVNDIAGFELRYHKGTGGTWDMAQKVQEGLVTTQPYEATTVKSGTHTIFIKAVDNAGQYSQTAASCVVDFGDLIQDNVLDTNNFHNGNTWVTEVLSGGAVNANGTITTNTASVAWSGAELPAWTSPSTNAWRAVWSNLYVEFKHTATCGGYWWLEYDITGAYELYYWLNTDTIKKPFNAKVKVNAGDVIHISIEAMNNYVCITSLKSIIDVPDRIEHFNNVAISTDGTTLPIVTPNYKTVAVRIDSIPLDGSTPLYPQVVTTEPCVIKLVSADGTAHSANAMGITWQGYEREV